MFLQDLAQSPLMLSIITLAYQGISLDELPQRSGLDDWRQHLFDRYIQRMFKRRRGQGKYSQDTLIFGLIGVFTMAVLGQMVGVPILFSAVIGLLFGLFSPAGIACIQHFTLRLVLYCSGCIPWNYARFLDYATQQIFLQKVGGGYIFIHRLLLEHFAQMERKM
ncbi:MAG: hypothetical protein RIG63_13015 [Coleofasciculus chthonoplastes F3-SA18-01]